MKLLSLLSTQLCGFFGSFISSKRKVKTVDRMTEVAFPQLSAGLRIQSVIRFVFGDASRISQPGTGTPTTKVVGGGANYYLAIFPQNLHVIERHWIGGLPLAPP